MRCADSSRPSAVDSAGMAAPLVALSQYSTEMLPSHFWKEGSIVDFPNPYVQWEQEEG